jgi:hypothetical protein
MTRPRSPKLVRKPLQVTPELQALAEKFYPIPKGAKIWQGFSWNDAQGCKRRMRLYFDDGLQLDAKFGAPIDGMQTIGNYSLKFNLVTERNAA